MRRVKNTKGKGTRLELRARKELEALGYLVVRAAGSLGPVDLVGIPENTGRLRYPRATKLIQVKANRNPRSPEMAELRRLRRKLSRDKFAVEIWRFNDRDKDFHVKDVR